jgi:hypothetical protein
MFMSPSSWARTAIAPIGVLEGPTDEMDMGTMERKPKIGPGGFSALWDLEHGAGRPFNGEEKRLRRPGATVGFPWISYLLHVGTDPECHTPFIRHSTLISEDHQPEATSPLRSNQAPP